MSGLKIEFLEGGAVLTQSTVSGFAATVQNALVNIGTALGSDPVHPTRGTNILQDGLSGRVPDIVRASHSANYAATRTLFFSRETDVVYGDDSLDAVEIATLSLANSRLRLHVRMLGVGGQEFGGAIPLL